MNGPLPGLDQLRELPLPAAVPYWPQTWGWGVVAILLLIGGTWAVVAHGRRYRRNRYRREALRELEALARAAASDPLAARALPALLKRTALAARRAGTQAQVATLSGQAWLDYLARDALPSRFPEGSAHMLATLAYSPDAGVRLLDPAKLRTLFAASRYWIERHHVAA